MNTISRLMKLPDWKFRLFGACLAAPFLVYATLFSGQLNIIALLIAMAILTLRAPSLRTKALAMPVAQAATLSFFVILGLGIMSQAPLSLSLVGLQWVFPFLGTLNMFSMKMPSMAKANVPTLAKAIEVKPEKTVKAPKDPSTYTNTYKRYLARKKKK